MVWCACLHFPAPSFNSRYLGGKLGAEVRERLRVQFMGQLCSVPLATLQTMFGNKTG